MDDDNAGHKYAYLLQPIKDIHRNFDIDIVDVLQQYNDQLAEIANQVEFEIDNAHRQRFNFAEAAMLIQGSVTVFGRKVDHVHDQALNFFEALKATKTIKKKKADDEGIEEDFPGNVDDDGECHSADMDPCVLQDFGRFKSAPTLNLVLKRGETEIPSISIMPMSLMPLGDFEKCNVPLYANENNKKLIGKKDDFKLNTGYMGPEGALLLDLLNANLIYDRSNDYFVDSNPPNTECNNSDADSGCGSPKRVTELITMVDTNDILDLDINQVNKPPRASSIEFNRKALTPTFMANAPGRPSSVTLFGKDDRGGPIFDNDSSGFDKFDCDDDLPEYKKPDEWEAPENIDDEEDLFLNEYLDSFENLSWKIRSTRSIKTELNTTAILKRRKKEEEQLDTRARTLETHKYINEMFFLDGKKKKTRGLVSKDNEWVHDALIDQITKESKRRIDAKRIAYRQRTRPTQKATRQGPQQPTRQEPQQPPPVIDESDDDLGLGFDDDDEYDPSPIGDALPNQIDTGALFQNMPDIEINDSLNIPTLYVGRQTNHHKEVAEAISPFDDFGRPTSSMGVHDILQFYMAKFWADCEAAMSRLAKQVQEWEERMLPLLEEEESRKEFDIHEYGNRLLDLFDGDEGTEVKTLSDLLEGKKDYEISRYFLANLMMANTYNVEIMTDNNTDTGDDCMNTMKVRLLKRSRHHEVFDKENAL